MFKNPSWKHKSEITPLHARKIRGVVSNRISASSLGSFFSADFEFAYKSRAKVLVFELMILPRRNMWSVFDALLVEQKS